MPGNGINGFLWFFISIIALTNEPDFPNAGGLTRIIHECLTAIQNSSFSIRLPCEVGLNPGIFLAQISSLSQIMALVLWGIFRDFSYPAPKITRCHRHNLTSANVFRLKICPKSLSTGAYLGVENRAKGMQRLKRRLNWLFSGVKFIWGYREAKTIQGPSGQRICLD